MWGELIAFKIVTLNGSFTLTLFLVEIVVLLFPIYLMSCSVTQHSSGLFHITFAFLSMLLYTYKAYS